jgi:tRNA-Thr(GGU) m(6)t(6)A37 methyltransferase TsaA
LTLLNPIPIQPIGYVENSLGRKHYNEWRETKSTIIISEEYQDALYRLEEFSHIVVLFYLHEMDQSFKTRIHPTGNPEFPLIGAFATRTPNRPSRIGLTTCRLLNVDGNRLMVKGLDAFNGSPVLDIKPYTGKPIRDVKQPDWLKELNEKKETESG